MTESATMPRNPELSPFLPLCTFGVRDQGGSLRLAGLRMGNSGGVGDGAVFLRTLPGLRDCLPGESLLLLPPPELCRALPTPPLRPSS